MLIAQACLSVYPGFIHLYLKENAIGFHLLWHIVEVLVYHSNKIDFYVSALMH